MPYGVNCQGRILRRQAVIIIFLMSPLFFTIIIIIIKGITDMLIKKKSTRKSILRLFAVFTALEAYRLCYMKLCYFLMSEKNGLSGYEEHTYILICLGIVAGLVVMPLLLDKTRLGASLALRVCITISATAAIASYFLTGYVVLALQFATSASAAGALAVCMRRIAESGLSQRGIGLFVGVSSAIMLLVIIVLFMLPFVVIPEIIILAALLVMLTTAMIFYRADDAQSAEPDREILAPALNPALFTPRMIKLAFLAVCLYALICGLFDNVYAFTAAFVEYEEYMFFSNFYIVLLYLAAGFLFMRVNTAAVVIGAFALICVGQSTAFFSDNTLLVFPYMIFSSAGDTMLEIFLVSLPMIYCALSNRKPAGIIPGLGYILQCGSFALMGFLWLLMPDTDLNIALGITLLIALAAIMLTAYLSSEYKTNQGKLAQKDYEEKLLQAQKNADGKPPIESLIDSYELTSREEDVLRSLLDGESTSEIAGAMTITEKSVRKYVSSILSKTGTKTRTELVSRFIRLKN